MDKIIEVFYGIIGKVNSFLLKRNPSNVGEYCASLTDISILNFTENEKR